MLTMTTTLVKPKDRIQLPNQSYDNKDIHIMIWISLLSYLWFGNWIRSLGFTSVVVIVSIFAYVLYEQLWERFTKNKKF